LICFVIDAATIVPIVRGRVEVWITIVIVVANVLETYWLLTHALQVLLLKTVLIRAREHAPKNVRQRSGSRCFRYLFSWRNGSGCAHVVAASVLWEAAAS